MIYTFFLKKKKRKMKGREGERGAHFFILNHDEIMVAGLM
jgi:hypothetical protein